MKYAVMDIGTNNTRMAVFDVTEAEKPAIILERDTITRLGENLRKTGVLSAAAMERTLAVLADYKKICDAAGATRFTVAGTAAMRAASNSDVFIEKARGIGLAIEIIPGELEAELSFRGVVFGMDAPPERLLVIDVGGGSTEFAYGERGLLSWAESVPMGAVVATEKYFRHDPPAADEIAALDEFVAAAVRERVLPRYPGGCALAGVAGTVSTLAMIDLDLRSFEPAKVHGHILTSENLRAITKRLLEMTTAERAAIPGMEPQRADIIHAGAAILDRAAALLGGGPMLTSLRDLRHGLLERAIRNAGR
jgi:exopolyphosphatase / guanosine-5'-triphosphate,3'-diphosphate pyrophosphatase